MRPGAGEYQGLGQLATGCRGAGCSGGGGSGFMPLLISDPGEIRGCSHGCEEPCGIDEAQGADNRRC